MAAATAPQTTTAVEGSFHSVDAARLRIGTRLRIPIYDSRDVLLLAEGQTITPTFLEKIRNRNIAEVKVHESELARVYACHSQGSERVVPDHRAAPRCNYETEATRALDAQLLRSGALGMPPQGEPFAEELTVHEATAYDEELVEEFVENHELAIRQMDDVFTALVRGGGLDAGTLDSLAEEALSEMAQDSDLFSALGINPYSDSYPARHSMHTSMLAMSIGTRLGMDRHTLKELAIGCLIHDSGMLKLKQPLYLQPEPLGPIEFLEITKHPVLVFDMMKDMQLIPARSAFIAYQIHERCNGQGYPRGREANQIHFLSKIAATADAFIGMVSPRPHRPAILPYRAIEKLIGGVREGWFDGMAVRALLQTVTLFPIGSYVELSDGRVGRVIRSNGQTYHKPVVEAWSRDRLDAAPHILDLAQEPDLRVIRPIPRLDAAASRARI